MKIKLGILIGLIIGAVVSGLCWIAEDSIRHKCTLTNQGHTIIYERNGEKLIGEVIR
jgi:hypothetical protein